MNKLLLVACLFLTACASTKTNGYIRTSGEASSVQQAQEIAFREAVQIKIGSVVVSERESNINKILRDDVSLYSAGYVEDFKVISTERSGGRVRVTVDVLVSESVLMNQYSNTGKDSKFMNGERDSARLGSIMEHKNQADRLIRSVMQSYPKTAFIIKQHPYLIQLDSNRNGLLTIPYEMHWNKDFIKSFNEAMQHTLDNKYGMLEKSPANVVTMTKFSDDLVLGTKKHFKFNDVVLLNNIKDQMTGSNEVRIMLEVTNATGKRIHSNCWVPMSVNGRKNSFYGIGEPSNLTIYGNESERGHLTVVIPSNLINLLSTANSVQLSVVSQHRCV